MTTLTGGLREALFREALGAMVIIAAETRPVDDATAVVCRVSETARALLAQGDDGFKWLTAEELSRLVSLRAAIDNLEETR